MPNSNPLCPYCGGHTRKGGFTPSGAPRFRCALCGRTHSNGKRGRPRKEHPLTPAERQARYREKLKSAKI